MADVTDATDFLLRNPGVNPLCNDHDLALDAGIIITRRESLSAGARQPRADRRGNRSASGEGTREC
jgi:hypothetical protein